MQDGTHVVQTFTSSDVFTPVAPLTADVLVVGGGGAGGGNSANAGFYGGGGGAGGFRAATGVEVSASATVTVGPGGLGASAARGGSGGASSFATITAAGMAEAEVPARRRFLTAWTADPEAAVATTPGTAPAARGHPLKGMREQLPRRAPIGAAVVAERDWRPRRRPAGRANPGAFRARASPTRAAEVLAQRLLGPVPRAAAMVTAAAMETPPSRIREAAAVAAVWATPTRAQVGMAGAVS